MNLPPPPPPPSRGATRQRVVPTDRHSFVVCQYTCLLLLRTESPSGRSTAELVFYTWVARSRSGSSLFTASALNKLSSSPSSFSSSSCTTCRQEASSGKETTTWLFLSLSFLCLCPSTTCRRCFCRFVCVCVCSSVPLLPLLGTFVVVFVLVLLVTIQYNTT